MCGMEMKLKYVFSVHSFVIHSGCESIINYDRCSAMEYYLTFICFCLFAQEAKNYPLIDMVLIFPVIKCDS